MPIPIIVVAASVAAGVAGVGAGAAGGLDIKKARDKEEAAKKLHEENKERFNQASISANEEMDELGKLELEVLGSFEVFSDVVAKIQNAPEFATLDNTDVGLPEFNTEEVKSVAVVAKATLGGLAGAAAGTAGGFAAAGATTTIVAALGTASTGTAISSLSGIAAYNATMATLGGGAIAAGGGGVAAGTAVLGGAAAGVGIFVGGIIINFVGRDLAKNAEELEAQVAEEKESAGRACSLLDDISESAKRYQDVIAAVQREYLGHVEKISLIVNDLGKTDWNDFSQKERTAFENTILLVGLLFRLCRMKLIIDDDDDGAADCVNHTGLEEASRESDLLLEGITPAAWSKLP